MKNIFFLSFFLFTGFFSLNAMIYKKDILTSFSLPYSHQNLYLIKSHDDNSKCRLVIKKNNKIQLDFTIDNEICIDNALFVSGNKFITVNHKNECNTIRIWTFEFEERKEKKENIFYTKGVPLKQTYESKKINTHRVHLKQYYVIVHKNGSITSGSDDISKGYDKN